MYRLISLWVLGCGLGCSTGLAWGKAYQWDNPSQEAYFEQLVACQTALKRHEWSKTLWPASNQLPKPDFEQVIAVQELRQMVATSLHRQAILQQRFNVSITQELLQHDLQRMAQDTQDPAGLREIYALFDHDPMTIAHCVSRPQLVESKLRVSYDSASDLHQNTLAKVHNELMDYHAHGALKPVHAGKQRTVTYRLGEVAEQSFDQANNDSVHEMEALQFKQKLAELQPQLGQITEHRKWFSYLEVLRQTDDEVTLAVLTWQKRAMDDWLATQQPVVGFDYPVGNDLLLPTISKTSAVNTGTGVPDTWDNRFKVPAERSGHTAVWTGTEMIIWGGLLGGIELNDGARYNPSTDSWLEMNVVGAPIARDAHTAVWTGSAMMVWGGRYLFNGYHYLRSGGVYDPNTDAWTPITTTGAPSHRAFHSAVWDGSEVLIWGGYDGATYFGDGFKYNLDTNTWSAMSLVNAPPGRRTHSVVWTGDEMIVWGGNNLTRLNTGGRYDSALDQWQSTSLVNVPEQRHQHTAVWTGELMVIWGGISGPFRFDTGGMYDPNTNTWQATSLTNAPAERSAHTAIWTGDEVVIWGGRGPSSLGDGHRFDPDTNSWTTVTMTNAPTARSGHTMLWTGAEAIVWGGAGNGSQNSGARYRPNTNSWLATERGDAPAGRSFHSNIWTGQSMLIWGGQDAAYYNDGSRYFPSTDSWTPISTNSAPSARSTHATVWTGEHMVVWGGQNFDIAPSTYFNDGGRYHLLTDSWQPMSNVQSPTARYEHSSVWTGQKMVVWGGRGAVYENTGGLYDPTTNTWTPTNLFNAPAGRRSHSAVWTGNEMIVWGGWSFDGAATFYDDGGRFDPGTNSWQALSTVNAPDARLAHSVVWTGDEMIVWGGGPNGAGNFYQTGGRYQPSSDSWNATSTTNAPSVRKYHSAIWTGSEMIVWGGYFSDGYQDYFNTGGRYDPNSNTWQNTALLQAPIPRRDHGAVWTGTQMIIWGGNPGATGAPSTGSLGVYNPYDDLIFADDFD